MASLSVLPPPVDAPRLSGRGTSAPVDARLWVTGRTSNFSNFSSFGPTLEVAGAAGKVRLGATANYMERHGDPARRSAVQTAFAGEWTLPDLAKDLTMTLTGAFVPQTSKGPLPPTFEAGVRFANQGESLTLGYRRVALPAPDERSGLWHDHYVGATYVKSFNSDGR